MVKRVRILVILAFITLASSDLQARSFRCTSTNQTIATDYKCFAKSYSRKVSTINMHFNLTRSIYKANVRDFCLQIFSIASLISAPFSCATQNRYAILHSLNWCQSQSLWIPKRHREQRGDQMGNGYDLKDYSKRFASSMSLHWRT